MDSIWPVHYWYFNLIVAYLLVVKCYLTKVSIFISLMTRLSLKASVF